MPTYPVTPAPADALAVLRSDYLNPAFGVHCRGEYPGYLVRHLREIGVELGITDEDRETQAPDPTVGSADAQRLV